MANDFKENRIILIDIEEFEKQKAMNSDSADRKRRCYIRETDFGQKAKGNLFPQVPSKESFLNWYVTPARHQAYSNFWLFLTCAIFSSNIILYAFL